VHPLQILQTFGRRPRQVLANQVQILRLVRQIGKGHSPALWWHDRSIPGRYRTGSNYFFTFFTPSSPQGFSTGIVAHTYIRCEVM